MKTVVTAGEIVVEIMATRVGQTFLEPGPLIGPFPSGAPAIFIDQVGRLGQPCGMISSVGADDFGTINIERLRASGVDTSAIAVHEGAATGSAFVRYNADGSRNFVYNIAHSACGLMALDGAGEALIERADHVHVMGSSLFSAGAIEVTKTAVERIKARGGTLSFDPNVRPELLADGMREALHWMAARCDVFLPSGAELFLFTRSQVEEDAVAEILAGGCSVVVLKKGSEGAVHYDRAGRTALPAFRAEEVDPTGAGDCFGAGFVCAWLRGEAPADALRLANACGALAVAKKGPMEGTAFRAEIDAFLASQNEVDAA
ncbi:sugar kinase [Aureimonas sp. ME7]|uniref:sugar kinase n=1 Tax=Aureimonas sp. ME7 TaxID=2744252 RepID=UPI0015F6E273|nr:sugar kinase [Aureimonas sp. ME7]